MITWRNIRESLRRPSGWGFLALIVALIALLADPRDGFLNLLAETFGVFAGAFLTVVLIETYLKRRDDERWNPVRDLTQKSLVALVGDIAVEFYFLALDLHDRNEKSKIGKPNEQAEEFELPIGILQMDNRFTATIEGAEVIESLTAYLRRFEGVASPYDLFRKIAPYLNQFRVHTARLLDIGRSPDLIQVLLEVEEAEARLAKQSEVDDATGRRIPNLTAALDLLTKLNALYRHLL